MNDACAVDFSISIKILTLCAAMLALSPAGVRAQDAPPPRDEITFTTWTGPYMRSQMLGIVRPYEEETGVRVRVEHYAGGLGAIRDQVESANVVWDVVDLTEADSLRGCQEGLLERLSEIDLPDGADGTPFRDDFVEGALNDCGVGVIVWATAYAYANGAFGGAQPRTVADFFDTRRFPGARAIRNDPTVIMEWALIADGVAPDQVYRVLETPAGVRRALARMQSIRPGLQVWSNGREPIRLLNGGEVVMSSIWATTGAVAAREPGSDFSLVWDGKVIEVDLYGIPVGSRNREAALDFIRYASSAPAQARMVSHLPNGPTRRSALALVSGEVLADLPNNPAQEGELFIHSDAAWWSANHAALEEAFRIWLETPAQAGPAGTTR